MTRLLTICLLTLALAAGTATAATTIAGGTIINQTWTAAGSPYVIEGDITVPVGSTLTIGAGVEVRANANSDAQAAGNNTARVEILIEGALVVNGTAGSPVALRSSVATAGSWYGLIAGAAASVELTHVRIESAINGLESRTTGSLTTDHVTVDGASSRGLWLLAGSPTLDTVSVANVTGTGIRVEGSASPTLTRCVIRNSSSYGVYITHSSAGRTVTLDRCTLDDNGSYGVITAASTGNQAVVTIVSSIITSTGYGVFRNDAASIAVSSSNVWNNPSGNFFGVTPGAAVIATNPLFVSTTDLRLTSNSPSRFAGAGSIDQGGLPYDTVATTGLVGTLWSNTTLTAAGSPYTATGDLTVGPGVTLTIEPGVTLRFQGSSDQMFAGENTARGELTVAGTLIADGTPTSPITITSTTASAGSWYGIDLTTATASRLDEIRTSYAINGLVYRTTGAGNAVSNITADAASSRGFWLLTGAATFDGLVATNVTGTGVRVEGSSSPTLTRCVIRNSSSYGVYITHSSAGRTVTLDRCTLDDNGSYGVITAASTGNQAVVTIVSSIITSTGYGVFRNDAASIAVSSSNVWNNPSGNFFGVTPGAAVIATNPLFVSTTDLRLTSNSPSRFAGAGSVDQGGLPYDTVATTGLVGTLWTDTTLTAAGSPYTVLGDLTVGPGVTLTIQPGATLRFQGSSDLMFAGENTARGELTVAGTLIADGTRANPITITSTTASAGSWYGIDLTTATASRLDEIRTSYAINGLVYRTTGAGNSVAHITADAASSRGFWLLTGAATFDGLVATNVTGTGIRIEGSASPTLTSCVIRNSSSYGVYITHSSAGRTVTLSSCTLDDNGSYGVITAASTGNQAVVTIVNSIVTNTGYGVFRNDAATVAVSYSDVWNNPSGNFFGVTPGAGMLNANPQFVSTTDVHLQGSSVAIDAGTSGGPTTDADGLSRPLDGNGIGGAQWDMGAYEFVLVAQCGNGALETGETCDSGASNGMYGACNATCTGFGPRCGDGMMNGTEQCDDGNASNTDACLTTCQSASCGDGFVRAGTEACDDGNTSNTDACTGTCAVASCGDGFVRAGTEACDDGNAVTTDACLPTCVAASCGDGQVYAGVETCDDANAINTDACLNTCLAAACGDGFIRAGTETCDDGNLIATDACTGTCQVATCGDGVIRAGMETCDDGNAVDTDACRATCQTAACGDGVVQAGVEGCDDGNLLDGDACASTCVSATCGDGVVQAGVEECDDGNQIEIDGCRNVCIDAACGDGVVRDGVEECDDGNVAPGDGCSPGCRAELTPPDAGPGGPDGGVDPEPAGGGCCETSGRSTAGSLLLTALVLLRVRRRRPAR